MKFNEEEKAMWLEDWRRSGASAWAYARENGLNPRTFVKWTRAEPQVRPCFVEIAAQEITQRRPEAEILIEKGDVKIHIPLELGRNELRAVMEGLGGAL